MKYNPKTRIGQQTSALDLTGFIWLNEKADMVFYWCWERECWIRVRNSTGEEVGFYKDISRNAADIHEMFVEARISEINEG